MIRFFRIVGAMMLLGAIPEVSAAGWAVKVEKSFENSIYNEHFAVDSLPVIKKQEPKDTKQDKEKDKKPVATDKSKDPKQEPKPVDGKRPNIKEVPKARPKLRPGTVTDKVKIKRPPVKVNPGKGPRFKVL